jgi:hypothetical protein
MSRLTRRLTQPKSNNRQVHPSRAYRAMTTSEIYHVKRVCFCRGGRYLYYALMLVDLKDASDSVGRLYRLQRLIGQEMKISISDQYDAEKSNS